MKSFLLALLLLMTGLLHAQEVKIEVTPQRPVAGEVFQVLFRVFTDSDEEPAINFSPSQVEVVGKTNQGTSTRTVYANGKLTVTREILVTYEMASSKPGTAFLRDITIQVGQKTIRHPAISLSILKEAEEKSDVFVMAEVPKKSLFQGEGMLVRYYLYSKNPVSNVDVKKYPKLNSFLKRFLQEPDRTERVSLDGQIFLRYHIYAAKLFPEKVGELQIDPLSISVTYPVTRGNDPFAAFGMSREMRTRTFNSEQIAIQVKPLPAPVPSHFTGLIGKHDFSLEIGQNKLIVNEPLNVKLTVSGGGALENLEAPPLLKNPALEEFESNGDLKIQDPNNATKVFDYTFLAKDNLNLPPSKLTLSYFDPEAGKYVTTELNVPEIVISGGNGVKSASSSKDEKPSPKEENSLKEKILAKKPLEFSLPLTFEGREFSSLLPYLNFLLALIALVLTLGWFVKKKPLPSFQANSSVPAVFKKGQADFGEFARWMSPLIGKTGKGPVALIRESELDEPTKTYFLNLLSQLDQKDYSHKKTTTSFTYDAKHFKKLGQLISGTQHENV